jgi:hypothetical protein
LWLIKIWLSASAFVVEIATFAKPENVKSKASRRHTNEQTKDNELKLKHPL